MNRLPWLIPSSDCPECNRERQQELRVALVQWLGT